MAYFERKKEIKGEIITGGYKVWVTFEDEYHNFTVSAEASKDLTIKKSEIEIKKWPYSSCKGIYKIVDQIRDIKVERGFSKKISEIAGGRSGCVHMIDIFQEIGRGLVQAQLKFVYENLGEEEFYKLLQDSCMSY